MFGTWRGGTEPLGHHSIEGTLATHCPKESFPCVCFHTGVVSQVQWRQKNGKKRPFLLRLSPLQMDYWTNSYLSEASAMCQGSHLLEQKLDLGSWEEVLKWENSRPGRLSSSITHTCLLSTPSFSSGPGDLRASHRAASLMGLHVGLPADRLPVGFWARTQQCKKGVGSFGHCLCFPRGWPL